MKDGKEVRVETFQTTGFRNREERRKMLKENPQYRRTIDIAAKRAMWELEEMLKKKWARDEEN